MEDNILNAIPRTSSGKGIAREIRRQDRIPGVFYYRGDQNVPLSVSSIDLSKLLRAKPSLINLHIEGHDPRECILRDIQRDPVEDTVLHIDLMGIKRGQKLTVTVPVRLTGIPEGVKTGGGILQTGLNELEIECLPKDIPSMVEVDVTRLLIGQAMHISEIDFPALKLLHDPDEVVAIVVPPTVIKEPVVVEKVEVGEEEEVEGEEKEEKKTSKETKESSKKK